MYNYALSFFEKDFKIWNEILIERANAYILPQTAGRQLLQLSQTVLHKTIIILSRSLRRILKIWNKRLLEEANAYILPQTAGC